MFIGHVAAGYIWTKLLLKNRVFNNNDHKQQFIYFWTGILGSFFPDIDIFHFYLIDGRKHLHHSYWTHMPFFWLIALCLLLLISMIRKNKNLRNASIFFISNIFIHLLLDTVAGGIYWLYPFSKGMVTLLEVPVKSTSWIFNFVFFWTSTVEGILIILAALLCRKESFPKINQNNKSGR